MLENDSLLKYILIITSFALILSGCSKDSAMDVEPEKVVPVNVALSQMEDLEEYQSFPGQVVAVDEVSLSAKMGGKVEQILVKEGDKVRAGQVLIKLEQKDVVSQLNQAEAGLDAAKAQSSSLENAQLPQQIAQLESALNQAKANFENVRENYERMKSLYSEGAISEQEFDGIELQYTVAKEQHESAKTQLTLIKEKSAPESIAAAKAQVKQAEAGLAAAKVALDNCFIISPIDGIVGSIDAAPGQLLSPGVPVLTVGDLNSVEVHINVTEDRVNALKVGQEAKMTIDSAEVFEQIGKIVSISPFKDSRTQVYPVKILVPNNEGKLKSGMFARAELRVALHKDAVTVPEEAIVSFDGIELVYILEDGIAKAKNVITGAASMGKVVITEGLERERDIIVEGQDLLTDGVKVAIEGRGESK